ncbi:hypothetical protein B9Q04_03455 [Candidatus Marsarchaeota G2 archaeon BE_D]|jgi:hypothetical protein|uniref:Uncharacterized protein n=1 Tax=Candidatus Marsarchaeota G2 archaeon BE_D TaxID=1978158 RepID=A0A2R6CDH8_9ARCH|nr:MAG: hypothetical protein B9Q04_03455 [Candidatus Marsarchaeota G2 archaeon BE_D]
MDDGVFLVGAIIFMVGFALLGGFLGYYSPNKNSPTLVVRVFQFTSEGGPFPAGRNTSFVLGGYYILGVQHGYTPLWCVSEW